MKTNADSPNSASAATAGGTGAGTGARYDEKRDLPYPETAPSYAGGTDPDAQTMPAVAVTDSGVSNADVDEFTTSGNSLGANAGASRDHDDARARQNT